MNLNNGTLSKSVILEGVITGSNNHGGDVVVNNDGSFTSVSPVSNGYSASNLMFVTLNENLEIDPCLLPQGVSCSDNTDNIITNTQSIMDSTNSLFIYPVTTTATDITSQFSVPNDPIIQYSFQSMCQPTSEPTTAPPTIKPTGQPNGQPTEAPTDQPTQPTAQPTGQPTHPTAQPTDQPPTGSSKGSDSSAIILNSQNLWAP